MFFFVPKAATRLTDADDDTTGLGCGSQIHCHGAAADLSSHLFVPADLIVGGTNVGAASASAIMRAVTSPLGPTGVQFVGDLPIEDLPEITEPGLRIGDRELRFDEYSNSGPAAPFDVVGPATIYDLASGLRKWRDLNLSAAYWPVTGAGERLTLFLDWDSVDLRVAVWFDVEPDEDPALEASLPGLIAPIIARSGAVAELSADPYKARWLTIEIALPDSQRRVAELLSCAADVEALVRALEKSGHHDSLTYSAARDLILGGHAHALVSAREGAWLDVKGAPYLDTRPARYELAKDVAAFANAGGGLILIPATSRKEGLTEVVDEVHDLPRDRVDVQAWLDRIAEKVYPGPAGVEVTFVGGERGQVVIVIPPQPDARKPFLVRGAVEGERVLSNAVTLPWRDGDQTRFDDVGHLHSALRQQRQSLAVENDLLERVHLADLPEALQTIIGQARAAGLQVDLSRSGFRIHLPEGAPYDLALADLHPKMERMAVHLLLERLAPYGVPSHRATSGFFVADQHE